MKTLILAGLLTFPAFAADGWSVLKDLGVLYKKTEGLCPSYLDIMRWGWYESDGTISFAFTERPGMRPLTGYVMSVTASAPDLLPLGQGEYRTKPNQLVPIKTEFAYNNDGSLNLYFHHKGKGSWGNIFTGESGFGKENRRFDFEFSGKNDLGLYENLSMTYRDLKGLRIHRSVACSYQLVP